MNGAACVNPCQELRVAGLLGRTGDGSGADSLVVNVSSIIASLDARISAEFNIFKDLYAYKYVRTHYTAVKAATLLGGMRVGVCVCGCDVM